jgi:RNA polymerase sigma-70 factor (ECF subfamily)
VDRDPVTARHIRFERLYEQHSDAVTRYCIRRTRNAALADDACSETFLVAWRRLDDVPEEPLPWLFAVARRVVGNLVRGDARREALNRRLFVTAGDAPVAVDELPGDPELEAALADLREPEREALMLVYWVGLTTTEAARAMHATPAAVRVRLFRARRRLELELRHRQTQASFQVPKPSEEHP